MLLSIGIILLLASLAGYIFEKIGLPDLLAMLLVGMVIGPYGLGLLDSKLLAISPELRQIGLVIILLRAGLGLDLEELKQVGGPALRLSCLPGIFEGLALMLASMKLLGFSYSQGGTLGFIIAAVSPAIVVPAMIGLMKNQEKKQVATLILAGASLDDIFAISMANIFISLYFAQELNIFRELVSIPVSIILGLGLAYIFTRLVLGLFKFLKDSQVQPVLILASSLVLLALEEILKPYISLASLLGVMGLGFFLARGLEAKSLGQINQAFNGLWKSFKIFLFVLVGASINLGVLGQLGPKAFLIIGLGLVFRALGVLVSLLGTKYSKTDKAFIVVSYMPKATVQAAMGAVPLGLGMAGGESILALSVLSIMLTAPLGALAIEKFSRKLT